MKWMEGFELSRISLSGDEIGMRFKLICVVGARPNFMKIAPILRAFEGAGHADFEIKLVHTGQHYDYAMNQSFFDQLGIRAPDISLEVGSGTHTRQTAQIMQRFEEVVDEYRPDAVLVVGDVNSTLACALVAVKKDVKVVHVEAGLRSGDRAMPEEINRIVTDQLSDRLYVTEREAIENLKREGIDESRIVFVGNVMIDTLLNSLDRAVSYEKTLQPGKSGHGGAVDFSNGFALLTLHRPSNVDDPIVFDRLLSTLEGLSEQLPIVFPVHPRTREKLLGVRPGLFESHTFFVLPPVGYFEMLGLMRSARFVLTDSGGVQEETTALGVPCLTLRENTERPITVTQGTNTIVGIDPTDIRQAWAEVMLEAGSGKSRHVPEYWDGHASDRIVRDMIAWKLTV